ncbi:MAG: class I SAM-dependent methyltransferase [Deltaproteobacteria bacterium]|nr:class I SAM-dependent methyltransferase [Deltaproteobacteria bacterium]
MELNRLELWSMNNPIRRWLQKQVEFRLFNKLLVTRQIDPAGKRVLDLACGSGYSLKLISEGFKPSYLAGFDIMSRQIHLARNRFAKYGSLFQGDLTKLGIKNEWFDLVIGFGILHHLEDLNMAISEISRITKPWGYLLIEEPNAYASEFFRKFIRFNIPKAGAFSFDDLNRRMENKGFVLLDSKTILLPCFKACLFQKQL